LITILSTVFIAGLAGNNFIFPPEKGLYRDSPALQPQPYEITSQSTLTFALITVFMLIPAQQAILLLTGYTLTQTFGW